MTKKAPRKRITFRPPPEERGEAAPAPKQAIAATATVAKVDATSTKTKQAAPSRYKVVCATSLKELQALVNQAMANDFTPIGGPFKCTEGGATWAQAVTKTFSGMGE